MITREQVADLQPGDVVELSWSEDAHPDVVRILRGPLTTIGGYLYLGRVTIRGLDGEPWGANIRTLTVLCRSPRPLYINHGRTEPVPGDIARDADDETDTSTYSPSTVTSTGWWENRNGDSVTRPARLRLLVDGETGQVVP